MRRRRVLSCAILCALALCARADAVELLAHAPSRAEMTDADRKLRKDVELGDIVVEAGRPMSSASSADLTLPDLATRPHATLQEVVSNIPGLIVAQHQGGGKAPQWLVRGFDADHGTDFAVYADNLPVNLVSHAHGQGYADVNFIIPETIQTLQLYKGPYFAELGDFANAGALNIVTRDQFDENFALAEGGSFGTQRYVLGASPQLGEIQSLFAAQAYASQGPFSAAQHYARYNGFAKLSGKLGPSSRLSLSLSLYQGDWDGSGQIPLRAVQQGSLAQAPLALLPDGGRRSFERFDSIDPTEGGRTDREIVDLHYLYFPTAADELEMQAYAQRYKLALFSDFTFFKDTGLRFARSADGIEDVAGQPFDASRTYIPGDGIEQNDARITYGGRLTYARDADLAMGSWPGTVPTHTHVGVETRNDEADVGLYRQVRRRRFFAVNKVAVAERSVSGFIEQQIFLRDWMRLELGLRGDMFFFDAADRLPSGIGVVDASTQECENPTDPNFCAVRIHGNTHDGAVSPKASLIANPAPRTELYANFGTGFHSNDARNAILGSNASAARQQRSPLTQSLGYEIGVRGQALQHLDLTADLWLLDLDSELVFSGDAGNQEVSDGGSFRPAGKTRRWGTDFEARYLATRWLSIDYDVHYGDARFRDSGAAVPLAPTLMMSGGLTLHPVAGLETGLRLRYLGDRPANEDRSLSARGYALLDLLARYRWRNIEASMALLNLTDRDWREAQFADTSCLIGELDGRAGCATEPGQQRAHVDPPQDIHFTPGNPFNVRGGLAVYF